MKISRGEVKLDSITRWCVLALVLSVMIGVVAPVAVAHAWYANAITWSRSYAEASVPGTPLVRDDSGVVLDQTTATAGPLSAGAAYAYAHAHTRGWWGGTLAIVARGGGTAGLEKPFVDPVIASPGPGSVELNLNASIDDAGALLLSGSIDYNKNGFMEMSVIDIRGLEESFVSDVFGVHGSVESALDAGFVSTDLVLFRRRESNLQNGPFSFEVDIGSLDSDDVCVLCLVHAVSGSVGMPNLSKWGLIALGLLLAASLTFMIRRRFRTKLAGA